MATHAPDNTRHDAFTLNDLRLITWDPTESPRGLGGGLDKLKGFAPQGRAANGVAASQPVATRLLAIQKDGTWYIYGTDLPKNVTELYSTSGSIKTTYTYSPYGLATASGNTTQPIQWSSEYADTDLGLVYYNYRHYNQLDGRWCGRDLVASSLLDNEYQFIFNSPNIYSDGLGLQANIPNIGGPSCHVYSETCGYNRKNNDKARDLSVVAAGVGLAGAVVGSSSARFTAHAATCKIIYDIYKNASNHRPRCKEARTDDEIQAALQTEIFFRSLYLIMKCDHYLSGSRKAGSPSKEKGHQQQLAEKTSALINCLKKNRCFGK